MDLNGLNKRFRLAKGSNITSKSLFVPGGNPGFKQEQTGKAEAWGRQMVQNSTFAQGTYYMEKLLEKVMTAAKKIF